MKFLYSMAAALMLLTLLFALPATAAPPGDLPILIVMPTQVVLDGTPPAIIRTGTMIAEITLQDMNKAPTIEATADLMRPGFTRDTQPQRTATAGEIILARSLKGATAFAHPPEPMSRAV